MRLREFTPQQLILDLQIKSHEWKPDPEVIIKHNDLYARACEDEHEKPIFDSGYKNLVTPNSPKSEYDLTKQLNKWVKLREPFDRIPHKFPLRQTDRVTERIRIPTCNLKRIRA